MNDSTANAELSGKARHTAKTAAINIFFLIINPLIRLMQYRFFRRRAG
jgi:hypothetical protein